VALVLAVLFVLTLSRVDVSGEVALGFLSVLMFILNRRLQRTRVVVDESLGRLRGSSAPTVGVGGR
jgi:hypothetical protein